MINDRVSNLILSPGSAGFVPSTKYIGYWPMTQWTGLTTFDYLTQAATSVVDAANNWITGFTSSAWAVAGTPVKVRSSGSMPGGISATTIYYAGKPTADQMTFHASKAAALAGTGIIDITSQGTSNVTVYPAFIRDSSGQGNDLLYGTINETSVFATNPYMSSVSSGSADWSVGLLPAATMVARFVWPTQSFLCMFRVKFGTLVAGRSFFGNGTSGSTHGPRLLVAAADSSKLTLQVAHSGTVVSSSNSATAACSTTVEHHIALALDGPLKRATVWIDGTRDINIGALSLSTVSALNFTTDLRIGGASDTNSHAAGFTDYHAFAWTGSLPANIDHLVMRSASTRYHMWSSTDL